MSKAVKTIITVLVRGFLVLFVIGFFVVMDGRYTDSAENIPKTMTTAEALSAYRRGVVYTAETIAAAKAAGIHKDAADMPVTKHKAKPKNYREFAVGNSSCISWDKELKTKEQCANLILAVQSVIQLNGFVCNMPIALHRSKDGNHSVWCKKYSFNIEDHGGKQLVSVMKK